VMRVPPSSHHLNFWAVFIKSNEYEIGLLNLSDNYNYLLDACRGLVTIEENSDTVRLQVVSTLHTPVVSYRGRQATLRYGLRLANDCLTYLSIDIPNGGLQHEDRLSFLSEYKPHD
jgi:hypothetical protein